jgi:hypothetical protein
MLEEALLHAYDRLKRTTRSRRCNLKLEVLCCSYVLLFRNTHLIQFV